MSAQLNARFPETQSELDTQTGGAILSEGTVLVTRTGSGRTIFHAGHHHPWKWFRWGSTPSSQDVTDHGEILERCIQTVLSSLRSHAISRVAFPMMGTGSFGFPNETFARLFFRAVADFAAQSHSHVRVTLVVWEERHVETIVRAGTRALASRIAGGSPLFRPAGGHPLVAELRDRVREQADELLQEKQVLSFAEVGLMTDLATLLEHRDATIEATLSGFDRRRGGAALTFGFVRNRLEAETDARTRGLPATLGTRLRWLARRESRDAIARLAEDRNAYAHNRKPRDIRHLVADVEQLFGPDALPTPWEPYEGQRWLRTFDGELALLDGVDYVRCLHTWLLPRHRMRVETSYASLDAS